MKRLAIAAVSLALIVGAVIGSSIGTSIATVRTKASPAVPGVSHAPDEITAGSFQSGTYAFPGNVGIGTPSPAERLEVSGNIKLSGPSPSYKITNVADPTADSDAATKGYVDAASGSRPSWQGYTANLYTGAMGGLKGVNEKCDAEYPGSHACTYEDITRLGTAYPWTSEAWVVDGLHFLWLDYTQKYIILTKDQQITYIFDFLAGDEMNCDVWTKQKSRGWGGYMKTNGKMWAQYCDVAISLPCCK